MGSLKLNIIANYVGRSWNALLGIILIPIYINFIGIEAYGLVGFFTILTSVFGVLDLGIGSTLNRELARRSAVASLAGTQRNLVRTLEIIYWGIAVFACVIILVGAPYISSSWINSENLSQDVILNSLQLMAFSVALRFPLALYQGGLMGLQKQILVNIILIINGTLRGGGAILVLWLISPTIHAFFVWQLIVSVLGGFTFLIAMWTNLPNADAKPKFQISIIRDIWKYAAAISANAIIGMLISQLDKIILSKMLSLKLFAYYSIAATVASSIWMFILPFNSALFPKLVQLYEEKKNEDIKYLFHRSSQILSFILIPISLMLVFFSREILLIWIKDPIVVENAYLIMSFLVVGTLMNGLASLPANCAPAFGWPLLITYTNAIQSIIIIPLIFALVYYFKGIGASIGWMILNSTYLFLMPLFFFKRFLFKEKHSWYLRDIIIPLLVSILLYTLLRVLLPVLSSPIEIFVELSISYLIVLIFTGLTLRHVRHIMFNSKILSILKNILP